MLAIQRISSKWAKTEVLLENEQISPYIPATSKYSWETLNQMLTKYPMVYIKPDSGTYGNGVMRVDVLKTTVTSGNEDSSTSDLKYKLSYETRTEIFSSLEKLHREIMSQIRNPNHLYLIQQGIHLLRSNNRPFDLRILTQHNLKHEWETTGIIGRVAAPNKIVTNYHNGGSVSELYPLLLPYMRPSEISAYEKKLFALGVHCGNQLQKRYPNLKEIGLDVAIDEELHPWILEVNTLPAIFPFKRFIPNKKVYNRIRRYAISYGRLSSSKSKRSKASSK